MGKYQSGVKRPDPLPTGPQPIWRGIGCLLIVLVPILSYAAAVVTMPFFADQGLVPRELLFTPRPPDWLFFSQPLVQAFQFLFGHYAILATLLLTLVYILLLSGVFSVFYAFMYRMAAPTRYGPMDAPPPRVKVKKYKR